MKSIIDPKEQEEEEKMTEIDKSWIPLIQFWN